jgi:hypothetical protein
MLRLRVLGSELMRVGADVRFWLLFLQGVGPDVLLRHHRKRDVTLLWPRLLSRLGYLRALLWVRHCLSPRASHRTAPRCCSPVLSASSASFWWIQLLAPPNR